MAGLSMTVKKKRVAQIPVQISVNFFNSPSSTYSACMCVCVGGGGGGGD